MTLPAAPNGRTGDGGPAAVALYLEAELSPHACGGRGDLRGFAAVELRDAVQGPGGELEYEVALDNSARIPVAEAVVTVATAESAVGNAVAAVLWTGQTFDKPQVRLRGIVALQPGVSAGEIAAALRDRRAVLALRVVDRSGAPSACGELRQ